MNEENQSGKEGAAVGGIQDAYDFLQPLDRIAYWEFASADAQSFKAPKGPRKADDVFDGLCSAIHNQDRSSATKKAAIRGLPHTTKRLSADELQRAIRRLKDRLLTEPDARKFLVRSYCRWVQLSRTEVLVACLEALNCGHDDVGNLVGEIPPHSPSSALVALSPLSSSISSYDLVVVCFGLALNSKSWDSLWSSIPYLRKLHVQHTASLLKEHVVDSSTFGGSSTQISHDQVGGSLQVSTKLERLEGEIDSAEIDCKALEKEFHALREGMQEALTMMADGRVPRISSLLQEWEYFSEKFDIATVRFQCSTDSFDELLTKVQQRNEVPARMMLDRLQTLKHRTDTAYSAHHKVVADAKLAVELLDSDQHEKANELLVALSAVDALVLGGGELDEEDATAHDEKIRATYGGLLAVSLLRGRLCFDEEHSGQNTRGLESSEAEIAMEIHVNDLIASDASSGIQHASKPEPEPEPEPHLRLAQKAESAKYLGVPTLDPAPDSRPQRHQPSTLLAEKVPEAHSAMDAPEEAHEVQDEHISIEQTTKTPNVQDAEWSALLPYTSNFSEFKGKAWISSIGTVEKAPWTLPSFRDQTVAEAKEAWESGNFSKAYICTKALGASPDLCATDLDACDRLLDRPIELSSLQDAERAGRLRSALESASSGCRTLAIAITLEALVPSFPANWSSDEAHDLCIKAGLRSPSLANVLVYMLTGWASTGEPLSLIRAFVQATPTSPTLLHQELLAAQSELQEVIGTQWNAAGGRIVQTHSRRAWTSFVQDHVAPLRAALAPLKPSKSSTNVSAHKARQQSEPLVKAFQTIMSAAGVRHSDLSAARSGAIQIASALDRVIEAKAKLEASKSKSHSQLNFLRSEIEQLLAELPFDPVDRLCALMLRASWKQVPVPNPLRLPVKQLRSVPELVRAFSAQQLVDLDLTVGISVGELEDPLLSVVLLAGNHCDGTEFLDSASVFEHLREYGIENDRTDVLAALVPTGALASHESTQIVRRALELGDRAFESTRQFETIWAACDVLLAPQASDFRQFVEGAYSACSFAVGAATIAQTLLLQAWLDRGLEEGRSALEKIVRVRTSDAERNSKGNQFTALIASHDYRGAMELIAPQGLGIGAEIRQIRRTMWRPEAVRRFANPRATLVAELRGATSALSSLVSWWVAPGENNLNYRDTLRKSLYNVVSGEAGHAQEPNKRRLFAGKMAELRQHKESKTVINCSVLREWFQSIKANPTFLPQLGDFDEIALSCLATSAQAGNAVELYVRAATSEGPRVLSVFLEPNVSPGRRDDIASGLRKRQIPAVILDDIDICRLCLIDPGAHDFIPFLEVIFEQLDLELISPFSTLDGQHIRLESFVGRQQSAEAVAHRWDVSRIFSGRKLGKSAFLRYVANRYDGEKLSSNKTLHVLFISIAGGSSPDWVVDTIISEMNRRFSLWFEAESSGHKDAVDRFAAFMRRFADAKKDKNVLIILDEADAFVEEQLRRYEQERDRSLSFNMMKRMPESDGQGMPRVRFLFAGYRVTNTRGGVWANAGDVLILKPLGERDATEFLQGMLERIGVDIANHAPFAAHRCGYQPAVLIRFGDALLKRIRRHSRSPTREKYIVTHEDVLATMSDPAVLEEIRTVVNNNFQGNRVAAAVFSATLLALKDLEPGMALDDGPRLVLAKLRSIDLDTEWLASRGSDPAAQVERQLQEFVDRELLTVSDGPRFGAREYRLKFQNFGPVLGQQDLVHEVKQHIQFLMNEGEPSRLVESVLPDSSLDAIRYVFRESTTEECALAIAAGQWPEALMDEKAGIADRLGFSRSAVAFADSPGDVHRQVASHRIFVSVSGELLSTFAHANHTKPLLLLGGVDLLRSALERQLEGSDTTIDVRPFSPMSRAALAWWFEGVQAYVFKRSDLLDQVFRVTQGIPLLVSEFNRCLKKLPSEDIATHDINIAIEQLRSKVPKIAELLVNGPLTIRLTERELQLAKMIRDVVVKIQPAFDLQTEFRDAWDLCEEEGPLPPFSDERDRISLQLLLCIGLLPAENGTAVTAAGDLGRVSLDKTSVLFEVLNALGPTRED